MTGGAGSRLLSFSRVGNEEDRGDSPVVGPGGATGTVFPFYPVRLLVVGCVCVDLGVGGGVRRCVGVSDSPGVQVGMCGSVGLWM